MLASSNKRKPTAASRRNFKRARTQSFAVPVQRSLRSNFVNSQGTILTRRLTVAGTISSSGGGTITTILGASISGFTGWSQLAAIYDEYRIIGGRLTLCCFAQNQYAPNYNSPICVMCYDNDDSSTVLNSTAQGNNYETRALFPAVWNNNRLYSIRYTAPVDGNASALPWITTATTAVPNSVKLFAAGLATGVAYWTYVFERVVQFRGFNA